MKMCSISIILLLCSSFLRAEAWKGEIHSDLPALKKKAEAGDAAAMAEYAFHSLRCMGEVKFEPKLIFDYFEKSGAQGSDEGKVGLAHCYCFNVGTIRDVAKAEKLIREPFKKKHPVALKIMGYLYYGHHGVKERDLAKVREFNRQSAELGCIAAQFNLGIEFMREGAQRDVKEGMAIFRRLHDKKLFPMASAELLKGMQKHEVWDDQGGLFRECLDRVKAYAALQEPSALLQLGHYYREAGDSETAVSYFAQSANLGNGSAWFELWRQMKFGGRGEAEGIVWGHDQTLGNLAMRAYERGIFNSDSLFDGAWEITRRSWNKGYQEKLPLLEKEMLRLLEKNCLLHDTLGRLYLRAEKKKNPKLVRPQWACNHLIFHSHHGWNGRSELARFYSRNKKVTTNLAKAYACAVSCRKIKGSPWSGDQNRSWVQLQKEMTPEARKLGEQLVEEEFPHGEKHRKKAGDFLRSLGHLPAE